jgi:Protein of unknown function (DUF4236)
MLRLGLGRCYHSPTGFRFRRSIRLIPGLRLNLSKSGVSASVGTRGAWLTFGKRGTRATVGIPGTGISYTQTLPRHEQHSEHQGAAQASIQRSASVGEWLALLILLAIAAGVGWIISVAMR